MNVTGKAVDEIDLKNEEKPIHLVAATYEELDNIIREYEILHTVKFMVTSADAGYFNKQKGLYLYLVLNQFHADILRLIITYAERFTCHTTSTFG